MNDKRIVLVIACMASFITPFLASSVNVALPTINADFAVPDQALLEWIVTGFLLSAAIFVVPFGRIADIFGRKKIFVLGLSIIVVSSFLCSISSSVQMLIASRVVEVPKIMALPRPSALPLPSSPLSSLPRRGERCWASTLPSYIWGSPWDLS